MANASRYFLAAPVTLSRSVVDYRPRSQRLPRATRPLHHHAILPCPPWSRLGPLDIPYSNRTPTLPRHSHPRLPPNHIRKRTHHSISLDPPRLVPCVLHSVNHVLLGPVFQPRFRRTCIHPALVDAAHTYWCEPGCGGQL